MYCPSVQISDRAAMLNWSDTLPGNCPFRQQPHISALRGAFLSADPLARTHFDEREA